MARTTAKRSSLVLVAALFVAAAVYVRGAFAFKPGHEYLVIDLHTARMCAMLLSDVERPCSVRLALALAKLGIADSSDSQFIRFGNDFPWSERGLSLRGCTCRPQTVRHVGNEDTAFFLSDGRDYYVLPNPIPTLARTLSDLGIYAGTTVKLCEFKGRLRLDLRGKPKQIMRLW